LREQERELDLLVEEHTSLVKSLKKNIRELEEIAGRMRRILMMNEK
jgi:hypothetical protein